MAKENRPKEKMRLTIEFADNGIILRNPDIEDEVTLALGTKTISTSMARAYDIDHSEEYKAIGRKIHEWLMDVVVQDHADEIICTGAELNITATLTGRAVFE